MSRTEKTLAMREARERAERIREAREAYQRETIHLLAIALEKTFTEMENR